MARPTQLPEWATGGSAAVIEPSAAKKLLGWVVEKPAHQFFNWWQELVHDWIKYMAEEGGSIPQFSSIFDLVDTLQEGDTGLLRPAGVAPFVELWSKSRAQLGGGTEQVRRICSDAYRVFVATDRYLYCFSVSGSQQWVYDAGGSVTSHGLVCDGAYVCWAHTSGVYVFDAVTGTLNLNTVPEPGLSQIATDGRRLFTAATTGGNTIIKAWQNYQTGTPSTDWINGTAIPGADAVTDLSANGDRVVATHTNSTTQSVVVLDHTGGLGTLLQGYEFDPTTPPIGGIDALAVRYGSDYYFAKTGSYLWSDGSANQPHPGLSWIPQDGQMFDIAPLSGAAIQTFSASAVSGDTMTLTEEYLGLCTEGFYRGFVFRNPKGGQSIAPVYTFDHGAAATLHAMFIDPNFLFYGGDEIGGKALVCRALPPKPRLLTKTGTGSLAQSFRAPFYGVIRQECF